MTGLDRAGAVELLEQLHRAQNALYGGGGAEELPGALTPGVAWHVPGANAIAGRYVGRDAVMDYFERRRAVASDTFRLHPGEL